MADSNDSGSESSRVFDYTMLFDDITSGILMKLDSSRRCDVVDALVDELDMSMLMDARLKVFRFAKKKLLKTVNGPGNMDIDPAYKDWEPDEDPRDAERIVGEWGMIARKGKPRVALDIIELLAYVSSQDPYFPHKILKKRPKKSRPQKKKRPTVTAKQALIPFKPVQDGDDGSVDDSSESDASSLAEDVGDIVAESGCPDGSQDMFGVDVVEDVLNAVIESVDVCLDVKDDEAADNLGTIEAIDLRDRQSGVSDGDMPLEYEPEPVFPDLSLDAEPVAPSEMYVIPGDAASPVEAEAILSGDLVCSGTEIDRYVNLGISEPVIVEVPPEPGIVRDNRRKYRLAKLRRTDPVVIEAPPDPSVERSGAASARNEPGCRVDVPKKPASIMSTQTEWDLWGMPVASGNSIPIRPIPCRCDEVARKFNEWKAEMERELATRDNQYRSKLNFLREEKLKADAERDRMRACIAALSTKVADNTARTSEMLVRTQRDGIPTRPKARGAVAYQGWDSIDECPSHVSNTSGGAQNRSVNSNSKCDPADRSILEIKTGVDGDARRVVTSGTDRAIVHRDPDVSNRTRDIGVQQRPQDGGRGNNARRVGGQDQRDAVSKQTPPVTPKRIGVVQTPMPQRPVQNRPRNRDTNNAPGPSAQPSANSSNTRMVSSSQSVSCVSWVDQSVSDDELHLKAADTAPGEGSSNLMTTSSSRPVALSKSDILREAIVDTQLKELRNRQQNGGTGPRGLDSDKGEKRAYEVSSGSDSPSYAETAAKDMDSWKTQQYYKNKKKKQSKVDDPVLELLGVKESPNKDLFVIKLDYSRCRRPEQLEVMVKQFCKRKGVEILYAKAFVSQSDPNSANCKISVNGSAVSTLLADNFWPENAYARFWYSHNEHLKNRNDRMSDDECQTE